MFLLADIKYASSIFNISIIKIFPILYNSHLHSDFLQGFCKKNLKFEIAKVCYIEFHNNYIFIMWIVTSFIIGHSNNSNEETR